MSYIVFARKFRPSLFSQVVGQNHITQTLENAIEIGRIAQAYLFSGPRGIGKTSSARILSKALNCVQGPTKEPCGKCSNCVEIAEGRNLDVIEIDGASNRGIDEIRNLRENVRYLPARSKYKIYIIDEVHMLTKEAFNALLKTLEEPPAHVVFIFATTEPHKLPATILSRCQRYDFRLIPSEEVRRQLAHISSEEGISIDEESLFLIAKRGDGSMRDALSFLDQAVSFCGNEITRQKLQSVFGLIEQDLYFRLTAAFAGKSTREGVMLAREIIEAGYDLREFFAGLIEHFRNLLVVRVTESADLVEGTDAVKKLYAETAEAFAEEDILRLISIANEAYHSVRQANQPQISLELALIKMIKMDQSVHLTRLIGLLDSALEGNAGSASAPVMRRPSAPRKVLPEPGNVPSVPGVSSSGMTGAEHRDEAARAPRPKRQAAGEEMADLAHVREKWDTVIENVRKKQEDLVPFLREVTLTALNGNSIELVFPNAPAKMKEYRKAMRNQVLIQDTINQTVNKSYVISIRPDSSVPDSNAPDDSDVNNMTANAGSSHPIIGEIISLFDAEVVEPKRASQTSSPREDSHE